MDAMRKLLGKKMENRMLMLTSFCKAPSMLLGTREGCGWQFHNLAEKKVSAGAGKISVLQSTCTGGMNLIWIKEK